MATSISMQRTRLLALLGLLVLVLVPATARATTIADVASALRHDPVYNQADASRALSGGDLAELRQRIRDAGTPIFVVAKPLADAAVRDVVLYSARFERWREETREALAELGGEIIASAGHAHGLAVLLALPGAVEAEAARRAVREAGADLSDLIEVGSHAERFRM